MSNNTGNNQGKLTHTPLWMWAIGLLGLTFVVVTIGFMLYEASAGDSSPPDVKVEVLSIQRAQNGFVVEVRVVNEGGTTIEYVPSHSERQGGLFFTLDPQHYELQLRAKGYEKP